MAPTLLWLVVIGLVAVLRWFTVRRAVRRSYPIGRQLRTGFGATHFAITDGENSSTVAYSGLDRIEVGRGVIWMRRRQLRRRLAYPGGLFPGPEVDRMRAAAGR